MRFTQDSQLDYPGDDINGHSNPPPENVSISTSFHPRAQKFGPDPDVILVSCDCVYFYVHSGILLSTSDNAFNSLLSMQAVDGSDYVFPEPIISVPESSSVLNVLLCAIYSKSSAQYSPTLDTLSLALSVLKTYGVPIESVIASDTPLYNVLLEMAPEHPLDIFALASQYDLYSLAVASSSHLLSFSLSTLSDETAKRIGPIYLKRLFFMHLGRAEVFRNIFLPPPYPHAPTSTCDYEQQQILTRAWTLASAHLTWDARVGKKDFLACDIPDADGFIDVSTTAMEKALSPLGEHLHCELCRTALTERINILIQRWSMVKVWLKIIHFPTYSEALNTQRTI